MNMKTVTRKKEFVDWFFGDREELEETMAYIERTLIAGFIASAVVMMAFIFWLKATGL